MSVRAEEVRRAVEGGRIPAYVYGCTPNNMAKPNEWMDVEEYLHTVRTHARAAAAYLGR
jgi:acetylornithine deacetylase/succinyl-diaminopimelate desuccinylase-like protein